MDIVLAQVINGVAVGSIYALLATGFNLLFLVGGVFQFAYPHLVVLTMYTFWLVLKATGDNLAVSILATIGAGMGLSVATEPLFRPLARRGAIVTTFILSLGIVIVFSDIMNRQIHYGIPIGFPPALSGQEALARWGLATITIGQLATILGAIGAVVGFLYMLYRTKRGRAFRTLAQSPFVARLIGIPITKTSILSYLIAGLLGGVSAVFLSMSLGAAAGSLGNILAVKVFAVAMFAGLGNLKGGVIAGLILGLVESFVMGYLRGDWVYAVSLGMILVVVMWKPEGLFSSDV